MREFRTSPFGQTVDLDDPNTYKHLPDDTKQLRTIMLSEIGYFYCYTQFWYKDIFEGTDQLKRVEVLIKKFTDEERPNYDNILWYKEQIFLFQDEIENMC